MSKQKRVDNGDRLVPGWLTVHSRAASLARYLLKGPRAIMYPDDPEGLGFWLEPSVAMMQSTITPRRWERQTLFSLSSQLERDPGADRGLLLRRVIWDAQADWRDARAGTFKRLSLQVTHYELPDSLLSSLEGILFDIAATVSIRFERRELRWHPLPKDFGHRNGAMVITTGTKHLTLSVDVRWQNFQFAWDSTQAYRDVETKWWHF